jgi:molybdenum cofactor synthesis domain-containing protein
MTPLPEAQRLVLSKVGRLPVVEVPLGEAAGLVLAREAVAAEPVPPFDNSAMDGYAIRSEDATVAPFELEVVGDLPAGVAPTVRVGPGQGIRIMTGAPLPAGADAVVRVEDTELTGSAVRVLVPVAAGTAVRLAGGDVAAGSAVFGAGTRLTPAHVAVLATLGLDPVPVFRRPKVAICATGDELVPASTRELPPGSIRNSNGPMLAALLDELGVEVIDLGTVADEYEAVRSVLARAAASADVILTSGGVSMGEYDLVKEAVEELGEVHLWKVAIQPAKPVVFGRVAGAHFFGLPGNPVSVMVAFEQFARPALLAMMGSPLLFRSRRSARVRGRMAVEGGRTVFVRVRSWEEDGVTWVEPSGGQGSNVLSALAAADAFAVVPRGTDVVEDGAEVAIEMFRLPESRSEVVEE